MFSARHIGSWFAAAFRGASCAICLVLSVGCDKKADPATKADEKADEKKSETAKSAEPKPNPKPSTSTVASASTMPVIPTGPRFLRRVIPTKVAASSEFHLHGEAHPAKDAFDATRATAWNQDPKHKGGEWLEAEFGEAISLQVVRIDTGVNDWSSQFGDLYLRNAKVKKLKVESDGKTLASRDIKPGERVLTIRLDAPVKTSKLKFTFEEVEPGDKWPELGITEIGIYAETTLPMPASDLDAALAAITAKYEDDSAQRGLDLLRKLGASPLPPNLVTDYRLRVTDVDMNLDGRGKDFRVIACSFRSRKSGEGARRQVTLSALLGQTAPKVWSLLALDTVVAERDTEEFTNETRTNVAQKIHSSEVDDLVITFRHRELDPSGQRKEVTGLRVWTMASGVVEASFEQVFQRASKAKPGEEATYESIGLSADLGKVNIAIDGSPKASFGWDKGSSLFVPSP